MANTAKNNAGVQIRRLVYAALCLALCMVLPFVTGQIPQIGRMLSPMHIPVLLCGFLCGWEYGLVVGLIAPLLRFVLFGMPGMPSALIMTFELAAYGAAAGILYRLFPKKPVFIYIALILAMLIGRVVWGIASIIILGVSGAEFGFQAFLAGAFINAWPGIILHIILIPLIVIALQRAKLIPGEKETLKAVD